jgi:non-ribosomal peptide synthetase component F
VARVDIDHRTLTGPDARDWSSSAGADLIAYVMYTSGSTGQPKGVMAPHRAVARLAINNGYADFRATDRVAFASNPSFDASTMEVWATLLNGGSVVIVDQAVLLDPQRFKLCLEDHAITILWLTAGLFRQYAETLAAPFARLRTLITGGDIVDARMAARVLELSPPQRLLNGYGPTETTTFAATHEIREIAASATTVPIGRPISNARIYILDRHREPVAIGAPGEIHIGGAGVARGYLNRPELTAERFVASPFVEGDRFIGPGILAAIGRTERSSFSAATISRLRSVASGSNWARSRRVSSSTRGCRRRWRWGGRTRPATSGWWRITPRGRMRRLMPRRCERIWRRACPNTWSRRPMSGSTRCR